MGSIAAVLLGGIPLALGRGFSAVRELWLTHDLGPTDRLAEYVLFSTVFLAVGGLLSGVGSALMIREDGRAGAVTALVLSASAVFLVVFTIYSALPTTQFESPVTVWCLAGMLPFFAVYGVTNGVLIRRGRVVAGMIAAGSQPAVSLAVMLLPWQDLAVGASCGNLAGSVFMAALALHYQQASISAASLKLNRSTVLAGIAISAVSLTNIASPIIDRFFAIALGNSSLVLLNLSTIVYAAVTGTLGIALGNSAVGRSFTVSSTISTRLPIVIGILSAAVVGALTLPAELYIGSREDYAPGSAEVMTALLLVYALAIPVALLNQVWIRVWNRHASLRDMLRLAILLLTLNIAGNAVLVSIYGVVGIAIATVLVQLVQCLYLGSKWNQSPRAVALVGATLFIAFSLRGIVIA